jgi:hypothetical protein
MHIRVGRQIIELSRFSYMTTGVAASRMIQPLASDLEISEGHLSTEGIQKHDLRSSFLFTARRLGISLEHSTTPEVNFKTARGFAWRWPRRVGRSVRKAFVFSFLIDFDQRQ